MLGDQTLLVTALANLVSNAIAYSPPGSPVSISRRRRGDNIEIAVTDRGIGIAREDQERVFERFFRGDKARSRATGGSGLGLAIVKHVAANHNGTIGLWSQPGTGSTFTLSIPAYQDETKEPTDRERELRAHEMRPNESRQREEERDDATSVLIVEDEESLADPLAFLLRKEGFEATVVTDGPSALAEFDRAGADIVLLDLMLPGMSGTDVCKQLRARSSVPVIMVTARDSEIDKVVGLELGADDYVTKPYSARELIARIRAVLRRGGDDDSEISDGVLESGPVRMDVERHVVSVNGEQITLPLKEFDLLEYLMRNSGRVLTRGQLIDRVWGADYVGDTKTLDVHVKRLRSQDRGGPGQSGAPGDGARAGLQARGLTLVGCRSQADLCVAGADHGPAAVADLDVNVGLLGVGAYRGSAVRIGIAQADAAFGGLVDADQHSTTADMPFQLPLRAGLTWSASAATAKCLRANPFRRYGTERTPSAGVCARRLCATPR